MKYHLACPSCGTKDITERQIDKWFNVHHYECNNKNCEVKTFVVDLNAKVIDYKDSVDIINNDEQFEDLYQSIIQEECVICIGPNIFDNDEDFSFEEMLAHRLKEHETYLNTIVQQNGLLNHHRSVNHSRVYNKIRAFFKEQSNQRISKSILKKLSYIPFHFYISLTPDKSLLDTFNFTKKQYLYYNKLDGKSTNHRGHETFENPSKDNPIIYNLLGDIDKMHSLIFTYDDIYDFLKSIAEVDIPNKLRSNLKDSAQYILLGVPYEMWYTHLFLRVLDFHSKNQKTGKLSAGQRINNDIAHICKELYTMEFFSDTEVTRKFVGKLFDFFRIKDSKNLYDSKLRTVDISLCKSLIHKNKMKELSNYIFKKLKVLVEGMTANDEDGVSNSSDFDQIVNLQEKFERIQIELGKSSSKSLQQETMSLVNQLSEILENETDDDLFQ
ncbi:MAG: hypothetical protein AAF717_20375 [Bacteroidota bacterium]